MAARVARIVVKQLSGRERVFSSSPSAPVVDYPKLKFVVPDTGTFWQCRHDCETDRDSDEWGGKPRSLHPTIMYKKNPP